jgi:putative MATE family efflux protein
VLGSFGFLFGTGGGALVAKTLGEKEDKKANEIFSSIVYIVIILAFIIASIGFIFMKDIAKWLGSSNDMLASCVTYGRILMFSLPFLLLQFTFQSFLVVAEKPQVGLIVTLIAGITNMILDALFIAVFKMGVTGAALATGISQVIGGIIPLIYFVINRKNNIKVGSPKINLKEMFKIFTNGSSEFVTQISMSIVGMLYNFQLMKYLGESGVSAYGTFMYVSFMFVAMFIGYSVGVAPIIGFNYGAQNNKELKNVFRVSMKVVITASVIMVITAELLATPFSKIFVGYNKDLLEITKNAMRISSFCFLFSGLGIFISSFFTALNDGITSAIISFLRTLVFQAASILLLPLIFDVNGIWLSVVIADLLAAVFGVLFLIIKKNKYNY